MKKEIRTKLKNTTFDLFGHESVFEDFDKRSLILTVLTKNKTLIDAYIFLLIEKYRFTDYECVCFYHPDTYDIAGFRIIFTNAGKKR